MDSPAAAARTLSPVRGVHNSNHAYEGTSKKRKHTSYSHDGDKIGYSPITRLPPSSLASLPSPVNVKLPFASTARVQTSDHQHQNSSEKKKLQPSAHPSIDWADIFEQIEQPCRPVQRLTPSSAQSAIDQAGTQTSQQALDTELAISSDIKERLMQLHPTLREFILRVAAGEANVDGAERKPVPTNIVDLDNVEEAKRMEIDHQAIQTALTTTHTHLPPASLFSSSFPARSLTDAHHLFPFEWENCVDDETPFCFHFVTQSIDHPSSRVGAAEDAAAFEFGCNCTDGECDSDCECSLDAEARYDKKGRIDWTNNVKTQRYRECWTECSCACKKRKVNEVPAAPASLPAVLSKEQAAPQAPPNSFSKKKRSRIRQTARHHLRGTNLPSVPSPVPVTPPPAPAPSPSVPRRCFNRVVGRGPVGENLRLVVFRTSDGRGWGLKTRTPIEKGMYVCDYVGERVHEHLCEQRGTRYHRQNQMFYFYSPAARKEDKIARECDSADESGSNSDDSSDASSSHSKSGEDDGPVILSNVLNEPYSIDALRVGHVSRFINHDHNPNLTMVDVIIEKRDTRFVHGALFALKNIAPGTELTFDYGHSVLNEDADDTSAGLMKGAFICHCATCKRRQEKRRQQQAHRSAGRKKRANGMMSTSATPNNDRAEAAKRNGKEQKREAAKEEEEANADPAQPNAKKSRISYQ